MKTSSKTLIIALTVFSIIAAAKIIIPHQINNQSEAPEPSEPPANTQISSKNNNPCADKLGIDIPKDCDKITIQHKFDGLSNFRQFTSNNQQNINLKQGQFFRSDAFDKISQSDSEKLQKLNLKTIIDLRSDEEIIESPNKNIPGVAQTLHYPIGVDPAKLDKLGITKEEVSEIKRLFLAHKFTEVDALFSKKGIDIEKSREERYEEFATNFNSSIAGVLKTMTDKNNYPIAMHCQGGKDRTGFLGATILHILGYSEEEILRDYLTTNIYTYKDLQKKYATGVDSLKPVYGAHEKQIQAAISKVKSEYGSFDQYLETIGITEEDKQKIRSNLLQ